MDTETLQRITEAIKAEMPGAAACRACTCRYGEYQTEHQRVRGLTMASELKIGDYVIWDGVTDRIIGKLAPFIRLSFCPPSIAFKCLPVVGPHAFSRTNLCPPSWKAIGVRHENQICRLPIVTWAALLSMLHGGLCTARKDVLRPCDTDTVLLALARGGTTLPKD